MMGRQIFINRLIEEWKFNFRVVRSVIDWTICLYLIIPALIIFTMFYIESWDHIHHYWVEDIPFWVVIAILLFISFGGNIRSYLYEADLLHLIQEKKIVSSLKRFALLTSLIKSMFGTAIFIFIASPVLMVIYHLKISEVFILGLSIFASKLWMLTIKKIIVSKLYRRIALCISYALFVCVIGVTTSLIYGTVAMILSFVLLFYHWRIVTQKNDLFLREIEIENEERTKHIKLIYNFSAEIEKETVLIRKKPMLLFRNSSRLFQQRTEVNGLLELLIKTFIRNRQYVFSYYQILVVCCVAIFLFPIWLKWGMFIAYFFFIHFWLDRLFVKLMKHPFFSVVKINEDVKFAVSQKFQHWVSLPGLILTGGMVLVLSLFELVTYLIF